MTDATRRHKKELKGIKKAQKGTIGRSDSMINIFNWGKE